MSDDDKRPPEQTPIAGEIASGIFQIMNTAMKMGANITKGAAEITAAGEPVQPPKGTEDPINSMLHYGAATVGNVIRLVLPKPQGEAPGAPASPVSQGATSPSAPPQPQQNTPTVRPGSTLRIPLMIENPHAQPQVDQVFQCLSIVTETLADGDPLRLDHVRLEPPVLTVEPNDFEKLTVFVDVPENAAPGLYEVIIGHEVGDFQMRLPVNIVANE